jgi:hypothetical protein
MKSRRAKELIYSHKRRQKVSDRLAGSETERKNSTSAWFQRCESFLRLVHAEHVYGKHNARDVMLAGGALLSARWTRR